MLDPLAVLLLPTPLEEFSLEDHARDLLRAPLVIALEPPRVSWARLAKLPEAVALKTSLRTAKRLKLPGTPRVVVVYDPLQTRLALALLARHPEAELWYLRPGERVPVADAQLDRRIADMDEVAHDRAALELAIEALAPLPPARTWFEANEPLWARLEALGIAEFA
jgi:hypothetical protein